MCSILAHVRFLRSRTRRNNNSVCRIRALASGEKSSTFLSVPVVIMSVSKAKLLLGSRNELIDIHRCALKAIEPENLIKNSVQVFDGSLVVKSQAKLDHYDLSNTRIHVVGGGKSVMAMAMGLADVAKRSNIQGIFSHGRLSIPVGLDSSVCKETLASIGIQCQLGSKNNLPDEDSVEASRGILAAISCACDNDQAQRLNSLFIVLISGGGSACLTSPRYVSLAKKLEMIKFLVQGGANIVELNKVRRFYSNIKGGGLARYILSRNPSSRILSLILSDVIGDPIEFIASGPTCLNALDQAAQKEQADQVLTQYGFPIEQTEIQEDARDSMVGADTAVANHIIGNNQIAIDAAIDRAQSLGYEIINLGSDLQGDTESVMNKLVGSARKRFDPTKNSRLLAIGGGEATVKLGENQTWGQGGRAQEMALDYLISCLSSTRQSVVEDNIVDMLLAGTTDGQDGPTDVGACLASHAETTNDGPGSGKFQLEDAIEAKNGHDSNKFWKKFRPNWLVRTGLTGTNVMDLYMYSLASSRHV